jgi:hypothetical protein
MWKCDPAMMVKLLNQLREKCRVGGMPPQKSEIAAQALVAAFIARRMPCNPDADRPVGPYYSINVLPAVQDAISAINERTPIDVEKMTGTIYHLWRARAEVVLGTYSGKMAKTLFKAASVPAWAREDALGCDCSEDLLESLIDNPGAYTLEAAKAADSNGPMTPAL